MSDYTRITNFTSKDALAAGEPEKVVSGQELQAEFDAIATAIATKSEGTGVIDDVDADTNVADNSAAYETLAALALPAAAAGTVFRITSYFRSTDVFCAPTFNLRLRNGSTDITEITISASSATPDNTVWRVEHLIYLVSTNSQRVIVSIPSTGAESDAAESHPVQQYTTASMDFTAAVTLTLAAQHSLGTHTLTHIVSFCERLQTA